MILVPAIRYSLFLILIALSVDSHAKEFKSCKDVIKVVKTKSWKQSEELYDDKTTYLKYRDCVEEYDQRTKMPEYTILNYDMVNGLVPPYDYCKGEEVKQTDTYYEAVFWKKNKIDYVICEKLKGNQTVRTFSRKYK